MNVVSDNSIQKALYHLTMILKRSYLIQFILYYIIIHQMSKVALNAIEKL